MFVLEVANLQKSFSGVNALSDLNVCVESGAILALVGANGAGKTTALDIIGGQESTDGGYIRLKNRDVTTLPAWARALSGVGRTFQDSRLWPNLTVEEHLRIAKDTISGSNRSGSDRLSAICDCVELEKPLLAKFPRQMVLIDRRRLELVLAAIHASNILLIDEIGAGLGDAEARLIYRKIKCMVREGHISAAILVEHKLRLLTEFATELALLENGSVWRRASCNDGVQIASIIERMFKLNDTQAAMRPSREEWQ